MSSTTIERNTNAKRHRSLRYLRSFLDVTCFTGTIVTQTTRHKLNQRMAVTMSTGCSTYSFILLENLAIVAPSMTRWSADQLICKRDMVVFIAGCNIEHPEKAMVRIILKVEYIESGDIQGQHSRCKGDS